MRRGVIHTSGVFCGGSWLRRGVVHKRGVFCGGKEAGGRRRGLLRVQSTGKKRSKMEKNAEWYRTVRR